MFARNVITALAKSFAAALVLAVGAGPAGAQSYPSKPITILVGFAAGGPADSLSRITAQEVSKYLGQPVIVENRAGAAGVIAVQAMLRAPRDGYTLAYISPSIMSINPIIDKNVGYDPLKDIQPLTIGLRGLNVLVAHPSLSVKSVKDLIAYAKANPGKLNYGSIGKGSSYHFATEELLGALGITATHIPYKGEAQAITDLLNGGLHFMLTSNASKPHVTSGKLIAIASTGDRRSAQFPDLPTVQENGFKYTWMPWIGFGLAAGVPADVVSKLHDAFAKALREERVTKQLAPWGETGPSSPQELYAIVKAELDTNRRLIETGVVKVD
jgi:tripartite-type tricarboxylate transporter receptor subunit TctC